MNKEEIKKCCHSRYQHSGMTLYFMKNHAFTLIELLVVVLIIGILAAIALPQYQKAVAKSRAMQAIAMLKDVYEAAEVYYLAKGTWPSKFEDLDVQIPWTGNVRVTPEDRDPHSTEDWSISLVPDGVRVTALSGPYAHTGFVILHKYVYYADMPLRTPVCIELTGPTAIAGNYAFAKEPGSFCRKVFGGTLVTRGAIVYYYNIP